MAKGEAEKAGQMLDNTKNTINSSVQQANTVASNAKTAASNIADASQRVSQVVRPLAILAGL